MAAWHHHEGELRNWLRMKKEQVDLPEDLVTETEEPAAIDSLAACLPRESSIDPARNKREPGSA